MASCSRWKRRRPCARAGIVIVLLLHLIPLLFLTHCEEVEANRVRNQSWQSGLPSGGEVLDDLEGRKKTSKLLGDEVQFERVREVAILHTRVEPREEKVRLGEEVLRPYRLTLETVEAEGSGAAPFLKIEDLRDRARVPPVRIGATVPEPGAGFLVLTAGFGFVMLRRRK